MQRSIFSFLVIFFVLTTFPSFTYAQETTFDPICTSSQSYEECAVEKLNSGLLPASPSGELSNEEAKKRIEENATILEKIKGILSGFISFFIGAENIQTAYIPEVVSSPEASATPAPAGDINNTLAGPEGYYEATLPQELPEGMEKPEGTGVKIGTSIFDIFKKANQGEEYYCDGYIPEQICDDKGQCTKVPCPITGQ